MSRRRPWGCLAVLLLVWSAGASGDSAPSFEPEVASFFDGMRSALTCLNAFSFTADVVTRHTSGGKVCEERAGYEMSLLRPGSLSMRMTLSDETLSLRLQEGKGLVSLDSLKECRSLEDTRAPEDIVGWLSQEPAFRRILSPDPSVGWLQNVRKASISEDTLEGAPVWRLDLVFDRTDVSLWVPRQGSRLPVRLKAERFKGADRSSGSETTEISWRKWELTPQFEDDAFSPDPPAGFKPVERFSGEKPRAGDVLEGMEAPPFSLSLAEGGVVDLASFRGSKVLVLDFWATWCRPCRTSLQHVQTIAAKYGPRGAAFLAVNLMEEGDVVREWLAKNPLKIPAALDGDGALAESLRIEAVPTTVIIGQDGFIQRVRVGYDRRSDQAMLRDLDTLLDGRDLAPTSSHAPGERLRHRLDMDGDAYCAVFVRY